MAKFINESLERGAIAMKGYMTNNMKKLRTISAWFLALSLVLTPILSIGSVTVVKANGSTVDSFVVFGAGDSANGNTTQIGKNVQVSGGMVGSNRSVHLSAGSSAPGVRAGANATLGGETSVEGDDNGGSGGPATTNVIANLKAEVKIDGVVVGDIDADEVYLGDSASVTGNVISGSDITMVNASTVTGNVDAQDSDIRKNTTISGTLTLPDGVDPSGTGINDNSANIGSVVNGTPQSPQTFSKLTLPAPNAYSPSSNALDDVDVANGATESITPGTYRDLSFAKDSTVSLSSGHYVVRKITGSEGLTLNLDLSGGPIIIFAGGDVRFGKNTIMVLSGGDATSLYWETSGTFKTSSGSTIYGTVHSTKSNSAGADGISIGTNNTVTGALYSGQQVGISSGSTITLAGPYWGAPIPTTGSLKVNKVTVGGDGTFEFTGDAGDFSITTTENSGSETISDLEPETYSVTEENLGEGWTESENTCVDVEVTVGETAECTITNTYEEPGYEFPSTNDENRDKGWAHVNLVEARVGSLTLEFVSERGFASCFEYRTDGDTSQATGNPNFNPEIPDLYPYICINDETIEEDFDANEYVEVRLTFGAEGDERFDWTRFDVLQVDPEGKNQLNVSGTKFNNRNEDRDKDEGEEVLEGWEMRLYVEGEEDWELIATDVTDENGVYKFPTQQEAGIYHVCEVAQLGWHQVRQDWSGTPYHVVTDNLSPNASEEGPYCTDIIYTDEKDKSNVKYIGNALNDPNDEHQFSQGGIKFHNKNGDRDKDEGEEVLEGWEMRFYVEGDEGWELIDTDVTDENGVYKFKQQKSAGVYHVCEVLQEDWEQVRQDWSGTPYHIITDNISPNYEEEGPYCSTVVFTDEQDKSNKKYFGNRYVPVEPTSSEVTLCKLDDSQNPLPGWTVMLRGEEIETLSVPSENADGTDSSSLSSGVWHIFKAFGTWLNDRTAGENYVDAEYSTIDEWDTYMDGFTGYGENILDLQVDESFVDWGSYTDTHEYAMSYLPSVDGPVNFRIFDGQNDEPINSWYADNTGSLSVELSVGYVGVTGEDGCVTFSEVPFGQWYVDELLQSGWENVSGLGEVAVENGIHEFYVVNKLSETNGGGNNGGGDESEPVIQAYKWNDADFDGERGEEDWIANWRLALARVIEPEESEEVEEPEVVPVEIIAMSLTDGNGLAEFAIPQAGNYVLLEASQSGWLNTAPLDREVPLEVICDDSLTELTVCEETNWHVDSFFDISVPELVSEDITVDNQDNSLWFGNYQLLVISEETATEIETESAIITWQTDKPGTSRVVYDTVSHNPIGEAPNYSYAFSTIEDSTKVTEHSVEITGLITGETYYYRVISSASPEVVSDEHDFSTSSEGSGENGSGGGTSSGGGDGGGGDIIPLSSTTTPTGDGGGEEDNGSSEDENSTPSGRIAGVTDDSNSGNENDGTDDAGGGIGGPGLIAGVGLSGQVQGESDEQAQENGSEENNQDQSEESMENVSDLDMLPITFPDEDDGDCYQILNICWYWWLLLIIVLLGIYYGWLKYKEDNN
jgi:hypothetical protein